MGALLMAILKAMAATAVKGVTTAGKGALALGKKAVGASQIGKLTEAFGGSLDNLNANDRTANVQYDKDLNITQPSTQPPSWQAPQIPPSYSPLARSLQMQSMGPAINRPPIPSQYLNMVQQPQQAQPTSRGSFLGGLKEGFLGMPQTGESVPYYAGKLIPDIVRSKMGVSTAGEEARSQKLLQAYGLKEYTPEFKTDLQYSLKRLPTLNENQKVILYQQLAAEYPDKTNELKRIFFPQSQDNEFLRQLITSANF